MSIHYELIGAEISQKRRARVGPLEEGKQV